MVFHVNDDLRGIQDAPPIGQKRTQAFVNHFIVETVNALNSVAEICGEKMDNICSQVDRMETVLSILEDKLASIPGVDLSKNASVKTQHPSAYAASKETTVVVQASSPSINTENSERLLAAVAVDSTASQAADPTVSVLSNDPELTRFIKMVQFGVPVQAVKLKMAAEGYDPGLLNSASGTAHDSMEIPKEAEADLDDSSESEFASSISD